MTEAKIGSVEAEITKDELVMLKKRADLIGLKYHHKIGVTKLKEQIEAHLSGQNVEEVKAAELIAEKEALAILQAKANNQPVPETKGERLTRKRKEASKLIRIRVANMNPNKKDYDGEIFTVGNSVVGTFKKYVPYNADAGWHVPQIIVKHLQERECQIFYSVTLPGGQKGRKGKMIKELNVEILDPLTPEEVKDLANQQAMAGGVG